MPRADLEQVVDRALKSLPHPKAPHTLLPRVMDAVQAWSQRPWYVRGWFSWPTEWQIAALTVLIISASTVFIGVAMAHAATTGALSGFTSEAFARAAAGAARAGTAAEAMRVLWGALIQPLMPYAFGIVMLMCLACGLLGAALNRVVLGRI